MLNEIDAYLERHPDRHPGAGRKYSPGLRLGPAIFREFMDDHQGNLADLTEDTVLLHLIELRRKGLGSASLARVLSCLRGFFDYLVQERRIATNPATLLDSPKLARKLPEVLSRAEILTMLAIPDTMDRLGFRDRTMLELVYAAGLRVSGLISLTLTDFDAQAGLLRVLGKGAKERIVPLHDTAVSWLLDYQRHWRPLFGPKVEIMFLNRSGLGLSRQGVWKLIGRYAPRSRHSSTDFPPYPSPFLRHSLARRRGRPAHGADSART